ncbi:hypothetical protein CCASP_04980 [Corynebacterium caspium DSM 44850]|nr:hypothetical protein CCASP_04980 [Corynebacterium caspium DSM 44850]
MGFKRSKVYSFLHTLSPIKENMSSTSPLTFAANMLRGALIGIAELVPGISGGTVALIVGIYEKALHNASGLLKLARTRSKADAQKIDWAFLIAVAIGMLGAAIGVAGLLQDFVLNHPSISRGLFLGMVIISLIVPLGMLDPRELKAHKLPLIGLFIGFAVLAFFGTGFTATAHENPPLIAIFFAAMVAVCALILPGLSGSFLLLALGLYSPVIGAVRAGTVSVLVVFILGALIGLISFVKILDWLLTNKRTYTLVVMAGLMLGSLRALWPWQTPDGALLAPTGPNQLSVWIAVLTGAALVAVILYIDYRHGQHQPAQIIKDSEPTA